MKIKGGETHTATQQDNRHQQTLLTDSSYINSLNYLTKKTQTNRMDIKTGPVLLEIQETCLNIRTDITSG